MDIEISQEDRNRIELVFIQRMTNARVKFKSKTFYKLQAEFFSGVMAAYNLVPPYWAITIMTNREIVAKYNI